MAISLKGKTGLPGKDPVNVSDKLRRKAILKKLETSFPKSRPGSSKKKIQSKKLIGAYSDNL